MHKWIYLFISFRFVSYCYNLIINLNIIEKSHFNTTLENQ